MIFYATDKDGSDSETIGITVHPLPQFGTFTVPPGSPPPPPSNRSPDRPTRWSTPLDLDAVPVVWNLADTEIGTGGLITLTDPTPTDSRRYYRIVRE